MKIKYILYTIIIQLLFTSCFINKPIIYNSKKDYKNRIVKIEANSGKGFSWPYIFYIPKNIDKNKNIRILIAPNNTGFTDDNFSVHEKNALNKVKARKIKFMDSNAIFMMPIFPRFSTKMGGWKFYTHALDKITFSIKKEKKPVIRVEWNGEKLKPGSTMSFNFEDIFLIQENKLYRCYAGNFNPLNRYKEINELKMDFILFNDVDFSKSFNLFENCFSDDIPFEGFKFYDVKINNNGIIYNHISVNDPDFKITKLYYADDNSIHDIWNKNGEKIKINEMELLSRLDLQLVAMINDLKDKMKKDYDITIDEKINMFGFSASGMFCDRFSYLHPELINKIAIGAPGGMPMLPLDEYEGSNLNYPIGIYDLKELTGKGFNGEAFKKVKRFVFIGENDENDSVVYRDSFSKDEELLIFKLFGTTPVERHKKAEIIFSSKPYKNTIFKIYKDTGHKFNKKKIIKDIIKFYEK